MSLSHETSKTFIQDMPKAELHIHIEGSLGPELMFALAERNRVALRYASAEEVRRAYDFSDLQSFLDVYYEATQVLLHEQDFYDLTRAYLRKAAAQNVRRAEVFFGTAHVLGRGFPQVGPCQIVEVLFVEEHLGRFVINVQKGLEVAEVEGPAHLLRRGVPESDPVALGEREHQLRLQRTLDMDVQLRLWHILDESL